ncbi:MAG: hypothetical protein U5J63_00300 [Fodinibius sp.]|nr:hypothetical protein [Fodinibius sp.]
MSGGKFRVLVVLSAIISMLMLGCSDSEKQGKALVLSLEERGSGYAVSGHQLLDKGYRTSSQQGQFQAQLLSSTGKIIQKVSFEQIKLPATDSKDIVRMQVVIPAIAELHRVNIYRLDGSSGHYQLNATEPLASWIVPDSTKQKITTNQSL